MAKSVGASERTPRYKSAHAVLISPNATIDQMDEAFEKLPRVHLPKKGAVIYFLMLRGDIVYVGQSKDLLSRIAGHRTQDRKQFDEVRYFSVAPHQLNAVERRLIDLLEPFYNRQIIKPKPSRYKLPQKPNIAGGAA